MAQREPQAYDRALKSLFADEAAEILPRLVEGVQLLSEQNIEIDRSTLRADLVYNVLYEGEPHTLNLELQTTADEDMPERMLSYHVGLLRKHKLPVISVILYPFETTMPEPPYVERNRKKELLQFDYQTIALWTQDARQIVQDRLISMYTFLPAMRNVNVVLLREALDEMKQYYTRNDFTNHVARFRLILNRSTSLTEQEKQMVREEIYEYNSLIDNDPEVQERVAKGEIKGAQKILMDIVELRFPELREAVQQRASTMESLELLSQLAKQIAVAKDEQNARWVLDTYVAA